MRRIVAVATVAAAKAQLDAAGHAAAAPARRDPIDTTPGLRGGASMPRAEDEDYSACTTVAAELAFARLEIAALPATGEASRPAIIRCASCAFAGSAGQRQL